MGFTFLPNNLKTNWNVKITKETAEQQKRQAVKPNDIMRPFNGH